MADGSPTVINWHYIAVFFCAIMVDMEKIATDIFAVEDLRKDGFTYVDKTDRVLPLVDKSCGKRFFRARPRRLGCCRAVRSVFCAVVFGVGMLHGAATVERDVVIYGSSAAKYAMSGKRVTLIGLAFSKKRHTIVSSAIEPL